MNYTSDDILILFLQKYAGMLTAMQIEHIAEMLINSKDFADQWNALEEEAIDNGMHSFLENINSAEKLQQLKEKLITGKS